MTEEEERKRNGKITQAITVLVSLGILISTLFLYVNWTQRQDDLRWCKLMVGLDNRYQALPSDADSAAREFASNIHDLRVKLHCPKST